MALRYAGYVSFAYFVVGFPQSIVLDRPVLFLMTHIQVYLPADMESLMAWGEALVEQTWKILLAIPLAATFSPSSYARFVLLSMKNFLQLAMLFIFPLFMLFCRKSLVPSEHYLIPFLVMLYLWLGFLIAKLPRFKISDQLVTSFLPMVFMLMSVGSTPKAISEEFNQLTSCRSEHRELSSLISSLIRQGEKLWLDPYAPYDETVLEMLRASVGLRIGVMPINLVLPFSCSIKGL